MDEAKKRKNIFYFLQYFLLKGVSVAGAILIIFGGAGLFFSDISEGGIKYLILCLVGFILVASISYSEFNGMNKKEEGSPLRVLKNKIK